MTQPNANDVIVALATPPGRGAISIIRLSGSTNLRDVTGPLIDSLPPARQATLRTLRDDTGASFDQAIVIYFPAPRSYTGENMVEIQTHGGEPIVSLVLKSCLAAGARLARPGEFSERAFLNGKLDLLQAEAVADLIAAGSERAARSAYNAMSGDFSDRVTQVSESLRELRTEIEAFIDFPDEEIPAVTISSWADKVTGAKRLIRTLLANARNGAKLNSGIDIAIIGSPNVGKSTLLNAFAGDEKAITSDLPGTTRDVVSVDIEYQGVNLRFHDTAGLREAPADVVEREGIKRTKAIIDKVDMCLLIREAGTPADKITPASLGLEDQQVLRDKPYINVWNKIDIHHMEARIDATDVATDCFISAKGHEGVKALLDHIVSILGLTTEDESPYIARERHVGDLTEVDELLDFDVKQAESDPELLAEKLRIAQQVLGRLVGEYTSEDLLGDIFSTFCIGK